MTDRFLAWIISGCLFVSGGTMLANPQKKVTGNVSRSKDGAKGVVFKLRPEKVDILVDGDPFTSYHYLGYQKPVFFPLRTASGIVVTRGYPMIPDVPGEVHDHPHHKGVWLTHGSINGVDFWSEGPQTGKILHREFLKMVNGDETGVMESRNDWVMPGGKTVLKENREVKIQSEPGWRVVDLHFTLTALDEAVMFGDTKEGSFGIRLAQPFAENSGGRIENSHGNVSEANCWGKQAEWVDFTTTIAGKTVGVAIFNHPRSFRFPTYWHVRGYTLFAANPFGLHDFLKDPSQDGSYQLKPRESMTLIYRVCIHPGSTEDARIAEHYKGYVEETK